MISVGCIYCHETGTHGDEFTGYESYCNCAAGTALKAYDACAPIVTPRASEAVSPSAGVGRGVEAGVAQSQQQGGGDIATEDTVRASHPKEQRDFSPLDRGSSPRARFDSTDPRPSEALPQCELRGTGTCVPSDVHCIHCKRPIPRTNEALPASEYPDLQRMREERDYYRALALGGERSNDAPHGCKHLVTSWCVRCHRDKLEAERAVPRINDAPPRWSVEQPWDESKDWNVAYWACGPTRKTFDEAWSDTDIPTRTNEPLVKREVIINADTLYMLLMLVRSNINESDGERLIQTRRRDLRVALESLVPWINEPDKRACWPGVRLVESR